jgi:hypothetical protein
MPTDLYFEKKNIMSLSPRTFHIILHLEKIKLMSLSFCVSRIILHFKKKIVSLFLYASRIIEEKLWTLALYASKCTHYLKKEDYKFWLPILFEIEEYHKDQLFILHTVNWHALERKDYEFIFCVSQVVRGRLWALAPYTSKYILYLGKKDRELNFLYFSR